MIMMIKIIKNKDIVSIKLLSIVVIMFIFSGCSAINNQLEKEIKNKSGILDDEEYEEYENWKEEEEIPVYIDGSIQVSFANNNNISIEYYYDQELQNRVDTNNCYVNQGDKIYSLINTNSSKELYSFKEFELFDVCDGERTKINNESSDPSIINIPNNYNGTMLSIIPVGLFNNREIAFSDYYYLPDGSKKELESQWLQDDEKKFDSITVNPLDEYTISCDYSKYADKFYISDSYPDITSHDLKGIVYFDSAYLSDSLINYSLQLHQYINLSINDDKAIGQPVKAISLDGEKIATTDRIERLKANQLINIVVDKDYIIDSQSLEILNKNNFDSENEYTLKVPDTTVNELSIFVLKSTNVSEGIQIPDIENGIVSLFREDGRPIVNDTEIGDNENVVVKITPNSGYYILSNDLIDGVYSKKMTFKKYQKNIDSIIEKHPIKKVLSVNLDTKDENGICRYTLDGVEVSGFTRMKEGQKLVLEYVLTSSDYKISRKWYGSVYHFVFNKNSINVEIDINDSLDGKTIKASDYVKLEAK